jgi:predicted nucleic acid-binding protein
MRPLRVFIDTSVFGGMFDSEFAMDTRLFFTAVDAGNFQLVVSDQVVQEILPAPEKVKQFFYTYLPEIDLLKDSLEVQRLTDAYLREKIVTPKYRADASHVAYSTVYACAGLVSWNFTHIVHDEKARLFNVVNVAQGYPPQFIATPKEISRHVQER